MDSAPSAPPAPSSPLDDDALDQLFRTARTRNGWSPEPVSEVLLRAVYDLAKWGPTSANCCPARFVFVTSDEGKARLAPHLSAGNRAKTMSAPVCVIIGYDLDFASRLPELFPHEPTAGSWFADPVVRQTTAFRNGTLQGAYLMLAARSLGLDCGPMSGFDNAGVDAAFFAGTNVKSNWLCNIGHGTDENLYPRSPRLSFEDACSIV
jgi:nitroreductase